LGGGKREGEGEGREGAYLSYRCGTSRNIVPHRKNFLEWSTQRFFDDRSGLAWCKRCGDLRGGSKERIGEERRKKRSGGKEKEEEGAGGVRRKKRRGEKRWGPERGE
jgi:hypothetical protein